MAITLQSLRRVSADRPPVILIHGGPGIGKTTFAANAPGAVFIRTEDGLGNLTADAFPVAKSFNEVIEALGAIYSGEHQYRWLVLDSLSALEPLIWKEVAESNKKKNIEDLGYGKGYIMALDYWLQLMAGVSALATDKKIGTILIAHTAVKRHEAPEVEAYDRAQIKLHERAFQLMYERCDVIGYAAPEVFLRKDATARSDDTRMIATGTGVRYLHLVEQPGFVAKNRYQLPARMALDWPPFFAALMQSVTPQNTTQTQNVAQAA